jgi:hypothetical protein
LLGKWPSKKTGECGAIAAAAGRWSFGQWKLNRLGQARRTVERFDCRRLERFRQRPVIGQWHGKESCFET